MGKILLYYWNVCQDTRHRMLILMHIADKINFWFCYVTHVLLHVFIIFICFFKDCLFEILYGKILLYYSNIYQDARHRMMKPMHIANKINFWFCYVTHVLLHVFIIFICFFNYCLFEIHFFPYL